MEMYFDFIFYITVGTSFWTSRSLFVDDPAAGQAGGWTMGSRAGAAIEGNDHVAIA